MFDTGKTQADKDLEASIAEQEQINADARAYLAETDWYVVRDAETGEAVPSDISTKRAEARETII